MNTIIVGFSATGKSSLLDELKATLGDKADFIDSNKWISKEYDENIYALYLDKYDPTDPVNRTSLMDAIATSEEEFIQYLKNHKGPYIAAIGPNVHTREGWDDYIEEASPYVIYLWADVDAVYKGLKKQENDLSAEIKSNDAFGVWNHGIIRKYDEPSGKYVEMPTKFAKQNVAKLILESEMDYDWMATESFAAISLLEWHNDYNEVEKERLIMTVEALIEELD
jgi:shikimate kinase